MIRRLAEVLLGLRNARNDRFGSDVAVERVPFRDWLCGQRFIPVGQQGLTDSRGKVPEIKSGHAGIRSVETRTRKV